jgi:superfamily II DNA or RNA helicase
MKPTKIENWKGDILVASKGTMSTGVSITSINNIIFASPSKSQISVLQSIGRALRLQEGKQIAHLYDIGDKLFDKGQPNTTFKHLEERIKIYAKEQFKFKLHVIPLK